MLLTAATGAMDATAFLTLGSVFASVMTGNLVLLGISAGTRDAELAGSAGLAFAGYATGTLLGSGVARLTPQHVRPAPRILGIEMVVLLAFTALWELHAPTPALLGLAAVGMGCQSAAIQQVGVPGLSTTFLTGTLTRLLAGLVGARGEPGFDPGAAARLAALVAGAASAVLADHRAPALLPAIPLCLLGAGLALAAARGRSG